MSDLFNCILHFKPSRDYLKLTGLISLISGCMLWLSGLPIWIQIGGSFMLVFCLYRQWQNPCPQSDCKQLDLRAGSCVLIRSDNQQQVFTQHRVLMDTGLFFLLELSKEDARRVLLIFFDQLTGDQWRQLNRLEKTTP